jgi:hypothetical protein
MAKHKADPVYARLAEVRIEELKKKQTTAPPAPEQSTSLVPELAKRLQQTLKNYGCYRGNVDGVWSQSSEQALALFARANGEELEDLKPTVQNILRVESGVSAGCPRGPPTGISRGCSPKYVGAQILSEPDLAKLHPDWQPPSEIGTSWSLADVQVIANSNGRYLYGKLISPRGGYQKWVYGRSEQWNCSGQ